MRAGIGRNSPLIAAIAWRLGGPPWQLITEDAAASLGSNRDSSCWIARPTTSGLPIGESPRSQRASVLAAMPKEAPSCACVSPRARRRRWSSAGDMPPARPWLRWWILGLRRPRRGHYRGPQYNAYSGPHATHPRYSSDRATLLRKSA